MSKQEHPYAEILRAIADGEDIQWKRGSYWIDQDKEEALIEIARKEFDPSVYRVKPQNN